MCGRSYVNGFCEVCKYVLWFKCVMGKNCFIYNSYDIGKNSRSSFINECCWNDDVDVKNVFL